ncbi:flagellar assembly peptidoglycan hydrolase FlgJ [Moellerella wisconsensis]|nr:flagellar assembly peptidoglycan hydrolase FlgJ [Moellerella wisconsensis]VFS53993.1 Peptidoglycan hydrolase flgJ [Moellerella wisconsensis]
MRTPLHTGMSMPDIGGAAFDVQSLNQLKNHVSQQPQQGLRQVAQQLESVFVNMMLKSMRAALPQNDAMSSEQSKLYTSLYDQQIAQDLSRHGLGFADKIVQQLSQQLVIKPEKTPLSPSNMSHSVQQPLSQSPSGHMSAFFHAEQNWSDAWSQNTLVAKARQILSPGSREFLTKLLVPARIVGQNTGIPYMLILAQAALESGWGKKEILNPNGQPSYNIFGIKSGKNWSGKTTRITTTEYIDGQKVKCKQDFRVYSSYLDALSDYAQLVSRSKRYQGVINAPNAEQAAVAIQKAGYATDPHYSQKLTQIIQQLTRSLEQEATVQYDLSELF